MSDGLYTVRSIEGGYRITKFDDDLNVVSSYDMPEVDGRVGCTCPQSVKPSCRHRDMLVQFRLDARVNTGWFYDWELLEWRKPTGDIAQYIGDNITATEIKEREKQAASTPIGESILEPIIDKTLEIVKRNTFRRI